MSHTGDRAVYALADETGIEILSKEPYHYSVKFQRRGHTRAFNRTLLCYRNYIPIQAMLFERSLYEESGGLDESLDALEDWDLWLRFAMRADFGFIEKLTSVYRVPAGASETEARTEAMKHWKSVIVAKFEKMPFTGSVLGVSRDVGKLVAEAESLPGGVTLRDSELDAVFAAARSADSEGSDACDA